MVTTIIVAVVALAIGAALGYLFRKEIATREAASAEAKAEAILADARTKAKDFLLQTKEKGLKLIEEAKREETERRRDITHLQSRLEQRENLFDSKLLEFENAKKQLESERLSLEAAKADVVKLKEEQAKKLEQVAHLTREEAKKQLMQEVEANVGDELADRVRKLQREGEGAFEQKARELLSTVMQRYAGSHAAETTSTVIPIPNEEMKGRIIGREGRNIKVIENLTGCEIIIDDTPGMILISGFSLLRRHLAKRVLEELLADGRIQPARIEETVERVKKDLAKEIRLAGEEAVHQVGVVGLDPKIVSLLGMLKFRTSFGQNNLLHAIEVSHLAGMLAELVGADVSVCKKGGVLHDVGKAVDHEIGGAHPELGHQLMLKYGLPEEVAYMAIAHHEDFPKTLEGVIVKVADALSASRQGARRGTYEQYVQRLEELEKLTKTFGGVEKVWAIQAGREVRVFVKPDEIDDWKATQLARDVANKIQAELNYPGEIKVTVIREKRIIEYAR